MSQELREPSFYPLTRITIGIWRASQTCRKLLLSLPERKLFVLVILKEWDAHARNGALTRALGKVNTLLDKRSPFASAGHGGRPHAIVALEVEWAAMQGLDFLFPLHQDARLVLEARHTTKRLFNTLDDLQYYYGCLRDDRATTAAPGQTQPTQSDWRSQQDGTYPQGPSKEPSWSAWLSLDDQTCQTGRDQQPLRRRPGHATSGRARLLARLHPAHDGSESGESRALRPASARRRSATIDRPREVRPPGLTTLGPSLVACPRPDPDRFNEGKQPRELRPAAAQRWTATKRPSEACPPELSASSALRADSSAASVQLAAGGGCGGRGEGSVREEADMQAPTTLLPDSQGPVLRGASALVAGVEGEQGLILLERRRSVSAGMVPERQGRHLRGLTSTAEVAAGGKPCRDGSIGRSSNGLRQKGPAAAQGSSCSQRQQGSVAVATALGSSSSRRQQGLEAAKTTLGSSISSLRHQGPDAAATSALGSSSGLSQKGPDLLRAALGSINGLRQRLSTRSTGTSPTQRRGDGIGCTGGGSGGGGEFVSESESRHHATNSRRHQLSSLHVDRSTQSLAAGGALLRGAAAAAAAAGAGGGGAAGGLGDVPRAARWTSVAATYPSRTIVVNFSESLLVEELRFFVQSDLRLLKLYESGLPAWAVLLPSFGLPYRPWFRRATGLLYIVISFVSMAFGFYDLYKNIPFVKLFVSGLLARIHLPAAAVFEWLELHTQIRLSILLTWLFSRSPLLNSVLRVLRSAAGLANELLAPLADAVSEQLGAALAPVAAAAAALAATLQPAAAAAAAGAAAAWSAVAAVGMAVGAASASVWSGISTALTVTLVPPLRFFIDLCRAVLSLVYVLGSFLAALLTGPVYALGSAWAGIYGLGFGAARQLWPMVVLLRYLAILAWQAAGSLLWAVQLLAQGGQAARSAAPAVAASAQLAGHAAASPAAAGGILHAIRWVTAEASAVLEFARSTLYRCLRAVQAVANCLVALALAVNRHRVSLLLQARRVAEQAMKQGALWSAVGSPVSPSDSNTGSDVTEVTASEDSDQDNDDADSDEQDEGEGEEEEEEEEEGGGLDQESSGDDAAFSSGEEAMYHCGIGKEEGRHHIPFGSKDSPADAAAGRRDGGGGPDASSLNDDDGHDNVSIWPPEDGLCDQDVPSDSPPLPAGGWLPPLVGNAAEVGREDVWAAGMSGNAEADREDDREAARRRGRKRQGHQCGGQLTDPDDEAVEAAASKVAAPETVASAAAAVAVTAAGDFWPDTSAGTIAAKSKARSVVSFAEGAASWASGMVRATGLVRRQGARGGSPGD